MKKIQKIKIYFFITFFFLFFDILLSQFFLLDLITKNREISHKDDIQNNRNHLNSLKGKDSSEWREYATKCMVEIMDNKR